MQHFLPGPSGSFEALADPADTADENTSITDPALVLGQLLDELGMVWCADHSQLEQSVPDHTPAARYQPSGGRMGFPAASGGVGPGNSI